MLPSSASAPPNPRTQMQEGKGFDGSDSMVDDVTGKKIAVVRLNSSLRWLMVLQIGSGLAGLTAACLVSRRATWEVHVFEKADKVGLDAASVSVTVFKDGKNLDIGIDVPMRSIDAGLPLETKN